MERSIPYINVNRKSLHWQKTKKAGFQKRVIQRALGSRAHFCPKRPKFTKSTTSRFSPEMEFLDISYTKDSSLFLQAIHIPFYWRILKKTIPFSGFKNPCKKIFETRKLDSTYEWHFVERKNEGRKPEKNSSLRRLEFMPRNLEKKCRSRVPFLG
jgi:hypothetical protein